MSVRFFLAILQIRCIFVLNFGCFYQKKNNFVFGFRMLRFNGGTGLSIYINKV